MGHYFKKFFRDYKENMLLLIIPIGLTIVYSFFDAPDILYGYNLQASFAMPIMVIGFQFFNGGIMLPYLYNDLREDMRWRLRATPHSALTFIVPAFAANWVFSIILGIVVAAIAVSFLNAYVGSFFILGIVLLLTSLMASFVSMLIFLLSKKIKTANAIGYVVAFGHFILSGMLFIPLGDNAIARFLMTYGTPISLGSRAVSYSGALRNVAFGEPLVPGQNWINIGILAAITIVLAVTSIIIGKVKKI
jgi:hypothetical protein